MSGNKRIKTVKNCCVAVGDVISCAAFANGWRRIDANVDDPIWVTDAALPEPEDRWKTPNTDGQRSSAKFVVEDVNCRNSVACVEYLADNCSGIKHRSFGQYVLARQINDSGSYNPNGRLIKFVTNDYDLALYQIAEERFHEASSYDTFIVATPITLHGRMKRVVSFQKID